MTRVWRWMLLFLMALSALLVPGLSVAQQISLKSIVVTRTDQGGGLTSGPQQMAVVQKGNAGLKKQTSAIGGLSQSRAVMAANGGKQQLNGAPGSTVNSVSFGSVAVGSTGSMNLIFDNSAGPLTFSSGSGPDYTITSTDCDNSCSVQVAFTPTFPGLRYSVVTASNSSGLVAQTFVYGTGTGPQVGFELGYDTDFTGDYDSRIQHPAGVTLGPDRTAYLTDSGSRQVYTINRYNPDSPYGLTTLPLELLGSPSGIAVDGAGTVYVADTTDNKIVSYVPSTGAQGTVTTTQLSGPTGLAVDGTGSLYIADTGNGRIIKIDNQGVETTLATSLTSPEGIAVDSAGDVFFNNNDTASGGTIVELPAGGGARQQYGSGLGAVQALAVDPGGTLYYSTSGLLGLLTTSGGLSISNYGNNGPTGIAVGPNGDLYLAEGQRGNFDTTDRSSGNFIVSAAVGGSAQGGLTLRNTGNTPLSLSAVATSEPTVYTIDPVSDCGAGLVVNPAATCGITVDYNPVTPGDDQQTVNVTSNNLNVAGTVKQFILYGSAGQTGTSLTVSSNNVSAGQPVTFTALVSSQSANMAPAGTVQFVSGESVIGTATLVQSGTSSQSTATFTTSTLGVGTYNVVATYLGSGTQATSSSDAQTILVTGGTTTSTTLAVSASNVSAGATETLTATIVGGSSPAVSGSVTFFDQNGSLGSATVTPTSSGGTAVLALTTLTTGNHTVYAMYSGDNTYSASTSGMQSVTVTAAAPAVVQSQNFGSTAVGTPVSMTLTFTGGTSGLIQATFSQDFTVTSAGCYSTCTATVTFNPQYPGLRTDTVTFSDGNGNVYARTYLYGIGTGPQFGFDPGLSHLYQSFATSPTGVAIGQDDTKFFTDAGTNQLRVLTGDSPSTPAIAGLGTPSGIAVDGNDTVYIADQTNNVIVSYGYRSQVQGSVATTPLSGPTGLAVDGTGALYIADTGNNRIIKIDNQGNETVVADGLSSPTWIALDAAGNLYYADSGSAGEIVERPTGDGPTVSIATSIGTVRGLAVDASNRVYYTSYSGVEIIGVSGGFSAYPLQGLTGALDGIAVGRAGDVVVAQGSSSQVDVSMRGTTAYFLTANVGGTSQDPFLISNTGNAALTLSSEAVSGTVFTIDPSSQCVAGTVVVAGQTCSLLVNFRPTAAQTYQETLTATSNSLNVAGSTNTYSLNGTGTGTSTIATTTTLVVSPSTVNSGTAETLTATIQGGTTPAISGTVTFYDQSGALGSGTVVATSTGGMATFSLTTLSVGGHQIYALYNGDGNYGQSTSSTQTVTVVQGSTTTSLAVSPATVMTGQAETLTATIQSSGQPALTQNVTFYQQNSDAPATVLGSAPVTATSTGGTASLVLTSLSVGSHGIVASYSGDTNFSGSTSGIQTVTVTSGSTGTATSLAVDRSSVVYRTPVAFTATVTSSAGVAVTVGQVIFCDVNAPFCNRDQSLATAQLNVNGLAVTRMAAGVVGSHVYRAVFLGTGGFTTSASASQTVVVTAPSAYGDFTTISSTGSAGSYTLTGSVTGLGTRLLAPGGTLTFNDTTNTGNPVLGTATLGAGTTGFLALQPSGSPVTVGTHPYGVATGDFNGDGYPDVVVENYNSNTVTVLLGLGNGSFQPGVSYAVGSLPERVLVADFDGDGNLDLVVANTGSGTVSVLLGNGDGTFRVQVAYACSSPVGLGVMDLNHDGFADIVAGDYYSNTVSVLLGNGDGTFRSAVTYATGSTPQTLAEGDFDGDGNVDLAVGNEGAGTVGILLGNGDGTFRAQVTYPVGRQPMGVQVGDFNRDGLDDLAVSNQGDGTVSVLLGNGDGTFQQQVTYPVGGQPVGLVVADFDGDGYQDLSVGNTAQSSLTQSILLGNGDGTFQAQKVFSTGNFPYGEAVADFDGNGFPDLAISNFSDNTATILLSYATETATASITGVSPTGAAGTHNVDVSFPGDANFGQYTSSTIPLTVAAPAAAATATSLTIRPGATTIGQSVGFFVGVSGTTPTSQVATGTVTLTNTGISPAAVLGLITLGSTGGGSFSTSSLPAGTYNVTATYGGDGTFAPSTSAAQMLVVAQAGTTAALTVSAANVTVGQAETLSVNLQGSAAPALSGMVTFLDGTTVLGSSAVTPSSSVGTTAFATASLTLSSLGVGPHSITARYSGDANYSVSVSAAQTVTVAQITAAVSVGVSAGSLAVGQAEMLTATVQHAGTPAVSGTVTFFDGTTVLGTATVIATASGGNAVFTASSLAVGSHSIFVRYSGDTNFGATVSVAQGITVTQAATTTSLVVSGANLNVNQTETLTATVVGGASPALTGMVTFLDGTAVVGTVSITPTATGGSAALTLSTLSVATHQYSARYSGDTDYVSSASGALAVVVSLVAQTITFPAIANHVIGDVAFALNATASSGLAVAYSVVSGPATLSGSSVTVTGAGTVAIQASQAGNATYAAATAVTQSFAVTLQPVVTVAAVSPASVVVGNGATTVTLTGTNFAARDGVQLNGAAIASTFVSSTTLTAVVPASFVQTAGTGQIMVVDPQNTTPSGTVAFAVVAVPAVVFSGPSASTSGQQPTLTLQLVNPYPTAITGTLTLTFAPTVSGGTDDPAVQFATGGRTLTFTIAANSTVTPAVLLQTGTVAGTATATLALTSNGLNVTPATAAPVVITIATAVPSITTAAVTRAANTLTVAVHGFSNTREITTAVFHFVPAMGSTINNQDVTVNVAAEFATWYGSTASTQYGSSFTYTQQFTLDEDVSSVASVTVTLTNSVGASAADVAQ